MFKIARVRRTLDPRGNTGAFVRSSVRWHRPGVSALEATVAAPKNGVQVGKPCRSGESIATTMASKVEAYTDRDGCRLSRRPQSESGASAADASLLSQNARLLKPLSRSARELPRNQEISTVACEDQFLIPRLHGRFQNVLWCGMWLGSWRRGVVKQAPMCRDGTTLPLLCDYPIIPLL